MTEVVIALGVLLVVFPALVAWVILARSLFFLWRDRRNRILMLNRYREIHERMTRDLNAELLAKQTSHTPWRRKVELRSVAKPVNLHRGKWDGPEAA